MAAGSPSNPEDILSSATKQFLAAADYSWTLREWEDVDRLTIRRKRPLLAGKPHSCEDAVLYPLHEILNRTRTEF